VYTVRAGRSDDVAALDAIDEQFEGHTHTEALTAAITASRVAVAEDDTGAIVGYVRWEYFWDRMPYCYTARVLPEHQRRGLGRRLYEAVEGDLRRRGHAFWLSSTEETNERSQRFHESLGFRPIGSLRELDQDVAELFYRKDLA
jgi:L-amino acid N-acyltransferase YncA